MYQRPAQPIGYICKGHAIDGAIILVESKIRSWPVEDLQVIIHLLLAAATIDGWVHHQQRYGISADIIYSIGFIQQIAIDPSSIHYPSRIVHRRIHRGIGEKPV